MTRQSKKDEELWSLNAYLRAAGVSVDEIEDGERPDFVVTIGDRKVGVEVTDFHVAGRRREVEEHWGLLRQWPMLLSDFPRHRNVELQFKALHLPSRRDTDAFVQEVFAITHQTGDLPATIDVDPAKWPTVGRYVRRLEIDASKVPYLGWHWNHDIAWIGVTEDELLAIVEAKRSSTVRTASAYWLIIAEGPTLSRVMAFMGHEWLEDMARLTCQLEDGPFERLILLQSPIIEWRRDGGWQTVAEDGALER